MYGHNKARFGEIWRDLAGFRRLVLLSAGGLAFVVWENEERVTLGRALFLIERGVSTPSCSRTRSARNASRGTRC
jgi:hypothetical protein